MYLSTPTQALFAALDRAGLVPGKRFCYAPSMGQMFVCLLFIASLAGVAPLAAATFSKDVAPIFFEHCVRCHRPNDIGPMSLLDYQSARPWAKSIREAVLTRKMPPWFADPRYGRFANDPRLSNREMDVIKAWVDSGAPEGNREELPNPPEFIEGWRLGKPDIVIDLGEDYVVKPGADMYEHFIVPSNLTKGIWIRAAELRPGNRRVVHHGHVNPVASADQAGPATIQSMNAMAQYMERDGKLTRVRMDAPVLDNACAPDAANLPYIHGFQEGALASFLPGREPDSFPAGSAKWIPAGTQLEFSIHYAKTSTVGQTDRTSVGLYLAPGPPERVLHRMDFRNFFFLIPPGDPNHEVKRCYTFETDKLLLSITPHMHFRGRDVRYELIRPNGKHEVLLSVPNYKFDWQLVYRFQDPLPIEKGSVLMITAHFDNSANNPANPDATKAIRWGDRSEEEMLSNYVEYLDPGKTPVSASARN